MDTFFLTYYIGYPPLDGFSLDTADHMTDNLVIDSDDEQPIKYYDYIFNIG